MQLGDILVGRGLVTPADIEAALARQLTEGGRLGDNLIAMGLLTAEQLAEVINTAPAVPADLAETGISPRSLLNLMLKFMHVEALRDASSTSPTGMKLPRRVRPAADRRRCPAKRCSGGRRRRRQRWRCRSAMR